MDFMRIRAVFRGIVLGAIGALIVPGLGLYLATVYAALIQVLLDAENDEADVYGFPRPYLTDNLLPFFTIVSALLVEIGALVWSLYDVVLYR